MACKYLAASEEQGQREHGQRPARRLTQEHAMRMLTRIIRCQQGANAIEYALVASLSAIAAVVGMQKLAGSIDSMFNNVSNVL
jgi:pilus assembly protein Flp/PilA